MDEDITGVTSRDSFLHSSIRAANPKRLVAAIVHLKSSTITRLVVNTYMRIMRGSKFLRELEAGLGTDDGRILGHEEVCPVGFCKMKRRRFPGT